MLQVQLILKGFLVQLQTLLQMIEIELIQKKLKKHFFVTKIYIKSILNIDINILFRNTNEIYFVIFLFK